MPVLIVFRFHLGQKLDEFGRLSDAVQISITHVARIKVKTADGRFSQPFDGFSALTFERIDTGDVVGGVMIERVFEGMLAENDRNLGLRSTKISFDGKEQSLHRRQFKHCSVASQTIRPSPFALLPIDPYP